jgi:hypothetical protein
VSAQARCNSDEAFDLCYWLPWWINTYNSGDVSGSFFAKELDYSFNGLPTLTVTLSGNQLPIATYKCNIAVVRGGDTWLIFSPLVVIWEDNVHRRPRFIIEHGVFSIDSYCKLYAPNISNLLIASGNLTAAKRGRPFFEALGWNIAVPPADFDGHGRNDGLTRALRFVADQIESAIAPFRHLEPGALSSISFAMLRIQRQRRQTDAWRTSG